MRKKIFSTVLLLLVCIFTISAFAGCGRDNEKDGENTFRPQTPSEWNGGVHEISVKEGTVDLISDGKCVYDILLPENAEKLVSKAASEISVFIEEACGVSPDIVVEPQSPSGKYLSLGDTEAARSAGAELSDADAEKLGNLGVRVLTKDGNVYMNGNTQNGVLYAAYTWLHYQFGFEVYGADEIAIATDVKSMKLKEMDIVDVPDIDYMQSTYGFTDYNQALRDRMRVPDMIFMPVDGDTWHNSFNYIDPDVYTDKKSVWFSGDGTQLCYTAHGNEQELALMVEAVAKKMKETIKQYPSLSHITITQQDTTTWCSCPSCTAVKEKYGSNSASVIRFCNSVSRTMQSWFKTEEGKPYARDLNIAFFAYHATEAAPVKKNEQTGEYTVVDETVRCDENVGVIYAPAKATYQQDFYSDYNKEYLDILSGWQAASENIYLWTYSTNFHYYLVPTNTYNSMQSNYRLWAKSGAVWLLDQAQYNNPQSTGFSALKLYLNIKLRWNVNEDMETLIDNFFTYYFGPAALPMRKFFNEFRAHSLYLENEKGYVGDCYLEPLVQAYWPKTLLERWISYCEEGYRAIESLREKDPAKYNIYYNNILLESISPRFLLLDLWGNRIDQSEAAAMRSEFVKDCATCEIVQYAEKSPISELWTKWGM